MTQLSPVGRIEAGRRVNSPASHVRGIRDTATARSEQVHIYISAPPTTQASNRNDVLDIYANLASMYLTLYVHRYQP